VTEAFKLQKRDNEKAPTNYDKWLLH